MKKMKYMVVIKTVELLLVFMLVSTFLSFAPSVAGAYEATMGCVASSAEVTVDDIFSITVWLNANASNPVDSWFVDLRFNESVLGIIEVTDLTIDSSWTTGFYDNGTIDNNKGMITGIQSFIMTPITTHTTLFTVDFTAEKSGTCNIVLSDAEAYSSGPDVLSTWSNTSIVINPKPSGPPPGGGGPPRPPVDDEEPESSDTILEASDATKQVVEEFYSITLEERFYANDTDGDGVVDEFIDPNFVLTGVTIVNVSGNVSFLISVDDDDVPEFFWDTSADSITQIEYQSVTVTDEPIVDSEVGTITITISVEKTDWLYIKLLDPYPLELYPDYTLIVKTADNRTISSDMIWRENGKIYVLDDAETEYQFIYGIPIFAPAFNPLSGTIFSVARPMITIVYHEIVEIIEATFTTLGDISDQLIPVGDQSFIFTPPSDLPSGFYSLSITAEDTDLNTLTSAASYSIQLPVPVDGEDKGEKGMPWLLILPAIIAIIAVIIIIFIALFKMGYLYIEVDRDVPKSDDENKHRKY